MYRPHSFIAILFFVALSFPPTAKAQYSGMTALVHHICYMSGACIRVVMEHGTDSAAYRESGCEEFINRLNESAPTDEQLEALANVCESIRESQASSPSGG